MNFDTFHSERDLPERHLSETGPVSLLKKSDAGSGAAQAARFCTEKRAPTGRLAPCRYFFNGLLSMRRISAHRFTNLGMQRASAGPAAAHSSTINKPAAATHGLRSCRKNKSGDDCSRFAAHSDRVDPMTNTLTDKKGTQSSRHFRHQVVTFQVRSKVADLSDLLKNCRRQSIAGSAGPNDSPDDSSQGCTKLLFASCCRLVIAAGCCRAKFFDLLLKLKAHDESFSS